MKLDNIQPFPVGTVLKARNTKYLCIVTNLPTDNTATQQVIWFWRGKPDNIHSYVAYEMGIRENTWEVLA